MANKYSLKRILLWAAIGAVLSLFLSHPPPDHLNPADRIADRGVAMIVWALLGAAASLIDSFFRGTPDTPVEELPTERIEPQVASPVQPVLSQMEEMEQLGVSRDGDRYRYQTYLYDRLSDAINYARKDRARVYRCK